MCTALACWAQCYMPARFDHWQGQTSNICSGMTGQWSDRSAMLSCKILSPLGPVSYLWGVALKSWTSVWRRKGSAGMDMWKVPMVQSRQPMTYRLTESEDLGGPRWHGKAEGLQRVEALSYRLGFLNGTILAIFDLQVTPMLPSKFGVNWPFGSGEAKNRFSRWWPSWISDRHDFSYF